MTLPGWLSSLRPVRVITGGNVEPASFADALPSPVVAAARAEEREAAITELDTRIHAMEQLSHPSCPATQRLRVLGDVRAVEELQSFRRWLEARR